MDNINDIISKYKGRNLSLVRGAGNDLDKFPNQHRPAGQYTAFVPEEKEEKVLDFDYAMEAYRHIFTQKVGERLVRSNPPENADKLVQLIKNAIGVPSKYPLSKGVYLYGDYSRGKTVTMTCIAVTMHFARTAGYSNGWTAKIVSFKTDIMMKARAEKNISFISELFIDPVSKKPYTHIIIDDLGYEDDSQLVLWGNKENVVVHLTDILYHLYQSHRIKLYITSNIPMRSNSGTDLLTRYGKGTHDRLSEMTTPVLWGGNFNYRTGKTE